MNDPIRTVELAGWELDEYPFRPPLADSPKLASARAIIALREPL